MRVFRIHLTISVCAFFPFGFERWVRDSTVFVPDHCFFMSPTSEKLRGHIGLGLSVRLSVRNNCWQLRNSRTDYARILKFYMWHVHEK